MSFTKLELIEVIKKGVDHLKREVNKLTCPQTTTGAPVESDSTALLVRTTSYQDEVRLGLRNGVEGWTKFGYADGLTAAGGEEVVWATTDAFTPLTAASTFTITYTNTSDGSTADGARQLTFWYVNDQGLDAISLHTLGSSGSDVTTFSGYGINRVAVSATGPDNFNSAEIKVTATTGGSTQAIIPANGSVTQQAIFFNADNDVSIGQFLWINVAKTGGGTPNTTVKGYIYNRNIDTRYEVFRTVIDASVELNQQITEPVGFVLNQADVLYFVADTDTNATTVQVRFSLNRYTI